jgi:hypothetical protein
MKELTDDEILEYLMTSEFNETSKPEEFKFLLHKFRYFYRILHGNHTRIKGESDIKIQKLNDIIKGLENKYEQEKIKSVELQNKIDLSEKSRKLTWKERFLGEISKW